MRNFIYSIHDNLAKDYGPPFIAKNDDVAKRQFKGMFASQRIQNVEDYDLWLLGSFESDTDLVSSSAFYGREDIHCVMYGSELLPKE